MSRKKYFQDKYGVEDIAHSSGTSGNLVEDSVAMLAQGNLNTENNGHNMFLSSSIEESAPKINVLKPKVKSKSGKKRIIPQLINIAPAKTDSKQIDQSTGNIAINNDPIEQAKEATEAITKRIKFAENMGNRSESDSNAPTLNQNPLHAHHSPDDQLPLGTIPLRVNPDPSGHFSIHLSPGVSCDVTNESNFARIVITKEGVIIWHETLISAEITTASSSKAFIALGSNDGSVYLYGTSITESFTCARLIRAAPPLIMPSAVHTVHLLDINCNERETRIFESSRALIVSSNLDFYVLQLSPERRCLYRDSIAPAFHNMSANANRASEKSQITKLLQIHLTKAGVLCVLSHGDNTGHTAFLYDELCMLWQRVGDSRRFVMSDFFSILPAHGTTPMAKVGESSLKLSDIETLCNPCAAKCTNVLSHSNQYEVTRAHCEDRMSVAILLEDKTAFEYWLRNYTRRISNASGSEAGNDVRFLVDLIIGKEQAHSQSYCRLWWWQSSDNFNFSIPTTRKQLLRNIVIPELVKCRNMQRLVREITIEVDSMMNE